MIQTKIQFNLKNAKQYFREHLGAGDYYSEGQKIAGEWLGMGCGKIGVEGCGWGSGVRRTCVRASIRKRG